MFLIAPLIAGAAVVGAGINYLGQRSANKANRKEAAKNRKFQERMRNTEWQAAIADMEAAGINPAVAYSQGGASAPSGSVAAKQESVTEKGVGTALAVQMQQKQLKLLDQQTNQAMAQARKTKAEGDILAVDRYSAQARMDFYFPGGKIGPEMRELLKSEFGSKMANNSRSVSDAQFSAMKLPEQEAMAELFERMGAGGKGLQQFLPLILSVLRGGR